MDASNERLAEGREELRGQRGLFRLTTRDFTRHSLSIIQVASMSNLCLSALGPASSPATEAPCYCLAQWLPPAATSTLPVQRPGHSVAVRRPGDLLPCCRLHLAGVLQVLVTILTPSAACRALDSMGFYLELADPAFMISH
jgi:hypothetical protein